MRTFFIIIIIPPPPGWEEFLFHLTFVGKDALAELRRGCWQGGAEREFTQF